jgi:polyisoprenoid-binding protein YceI
MFGLVGVKGAFSEFAGEFVVDEAGATGELRISAASLDTANAKRDKHLRSADFFDVSDHPTVTFSLSKVTAADGGGLAMTGVLKIRETALGVTAPLRVEAADTGHLVVSTDVAVDRAAAGVGWNKVGMIQGPARLSARLALVRDS